MATYPAPEGYLFSLFLAAIILPFPVGLKNLESVVACLLVIGLAYLLQRRRVRREGALGGRVRLG